LNGLAGSGNEEQLPVRGLIKTSAAFLAALHFVGSSEVRAEPKASPGLSLPPPDAAPDEEEYEATAAVEAPAREVTRRAVDAEVLTRVPGTRGDSLRSIEVMPGVARTSLDSGAPLIRGAGFNESVTLLNGTPIPFMYHFGGLTSFMSSRLVSRLDVYPGNFSARYGRVAGGVIEIKARDPDSSRLRAQVDLNLIDSSAFVELPVGEQTHAAAAVRRSNIDFFFENFVPEDAYRVVAAPLYWDYQAFFVHRFDSRTRLRVLGYGSRDSIRLLFSDPLDADPSIAGNVQASLEFHRLGLELESALAPAVNLSASATLGQLSLVQRFGELEQVLQGPELFARSELSLELDARTRLVLGGDFAGMFAAGRYHGPYPGQLEGDARGQDPLAIQRVVSDEIPNLRVLKPALYAELSYRPLPSLLVLPGVRLDYFGDLRAASVDPRLAIRHELTASTTLKWGIGRFTQAPEFWQALQSVGNPEIDPYSAYQTSAGAEQRFGADAKLGIEGFYKRLERVVVSTPNRRAPHYVNSGRGRILGAELSAEVRTHPGSFFYLAYTLSRSERLDGDRAAWRLFDKDQPHNLSLVFNQDLGSGFQAGARFRLVSGNPRTPITGAVYAARSGVYAPIYGALNSERNPLFHQLDVRVEKAWKLGPLTLAAYADVQNVYNQKNQEGERYSFDYSKRSDVTGLPIFPSLGLRGEL
jgi:hypothetical protein